MKIPRFHGEDGPEKILQSVIAYYKYGRSFKLNHFKDIWVLTKIPPRAVQCSCTKYYQKPDDQKLDDQRSDDQRSDDQRSDD